MNCSTPAFPVHHQLPELAQTHVHQISDAIQPSYPLPSSSPPAFNSSQHQGIFHWVSSSHQVAKVSASASVLPKNMQDWFPLGLTGFDLQGTRKSLLQHHSSKALIIWNSASFIVQLSHPYTTTGKTIPLTRWTSVGKVMSLLFIYLFLIKFFSIFVDDIIVYE